MFVSSRSAHTLAEATISTKCLFCGALCAYMKSVRQVISVRMRLPEIGHSQINSMFPLFSMRIIRETVKRTFKWIDATK